MEAGGKKAALESLSQEELVGKCKTLLQLAQKAKKSKDDLQSQLEDLRKEKNEEFTQLKNELEVLQVKNEENEDIIKVKQRQLARVSDENESLLEQMDTYCSQLKAVVSEKSNIEKELSSVQNKLEKSNSQSLKVMELEANVICFKEKEKDFNNKLKTLEENLEKERRSVEEKNLEILNMRERQGKLEAELNEEKSRMEEKSGAEQEEKEMVEGLREKENKELTEANETLTVKVSHLSAQCEELEKQLSDLESSKATEYKDLEGKIQLLESKNLTLSEEKDQLRLSNEGLIEELNSLNEEMKKRGEKLEKLENLNSENISRIKSLEKKQHEFETVKAELETKLKDTSDELKGLQNDTRGDGDELSSVKNQLETKNIEMAELERQRDVDAEELKSLRELVDKLEQEKKNVSDDMKDNKEAFLRLQTELEEMKKLEVKYKQELEQNKKEVLSKQEEIIRKDETLENVQRENSVKEENLKRLKDENEDLSRTVKEQSDQILGFKQNKDEQKDILSQQESSLKEEFYSKEREMTSKISELEQEVKEVQTEMKTSLEKVIVTEKENEELKTLNDELKTENQAILTKENSFSEENRKLTVENQDLSARIESLQSEIKNLRSSMEEMKEESNRNKSLNMSSNDMDDSRSEVMSTSTVSRVEEHSRMKDIEDSFEERYSKLKLIAIKLKKKVADQDKIIKELESGSRKEKKGEDDSSYALKEKLSSLTKNFNNLQSQYDEVVDKLESCNLELKTLRKDLETSIADNISNKQRSEESAQQALTAKTELTKAEAELREASGLVKSLEVTLEEERKERRALETTCKDNDSLASKLKDKIGENFIIEETLQTLKLQVSQLEESLQGEQSRADNLQQNLTSSRFQLSQAEADLSRIKIEKDELFLKYEKSIQSHEALQEQLASQIKESDQHQYDRKSKVAQLERQISALESNLTSRTETLDQKGEELVRITKEFDNYKLRAQSVLKQSQEKGNEDITKKKQEEIYALEKMNDALNDKLKSVGVELRTLTIERNGIQEEHDRLMSRHSLLMQEIATKEKTWREKIDQKEQKIKEEKEDKVGSMERIQKSIDNLKQSHRQEIEMIKATDTAEMTRLKQQLDTSENEVIRLELMLQKEQEARRVAEESCESGGFDNRLDIREIEREACEGQEVESVVGLPQPASLTSPVPLDQLLAQSDLPDTISEEIRSTSRAGGAEKQISHLAALLAESEAQNSRLDKLTEVLKEEIRTYQRSEERHKHIENLEYVKNVILKFLTLSGAQEKARLLPVLQTILKLKKEEVGQIENYIQVEESGSQNSEGWSSYLGLWSAP